MEQVKEPVEEEREHVLAIACRIMASVSPVATNSQTQAHQQPFPTPSPFSFSGTSTRWSSRPSIHRYLNLFLRFLGLLFSFISALTLAFPSSKKNDQRSPSFTGFPELVYCFIVDILAFLYSAFQLFKGVSDIAHRGILISDMTSDYLSFVLDQLVGYLLISSASVATSILRQVGQSTAIWKGAIVSASMFFANFLVVAICALLSGYKLCKRIAWTSYYFLANLGQVRPLGTTTLHDPPPDLRLLLENHKAGVPTLRT